MKGVIKYLNEEKGFGFLEVVDEPKDIFFHSNDLRNCKIRDLHVKDEVEFSRIDEVPKGKTAREILR